MTIVSLLCAASSVALGALYMFAAGAPRRYIIINVGALAVGAIMASLIARVPLRDRRIVAASVVTIALALLMTAAFGVHIDGASRWLAMAGISLQPSLILLPLAMMLFAKDGGWIASIGLVAAGVALAMQPDRAMAGTLAAGLAAVLFHRTDAPGIIAWAAAVAAFAATVVRDDVVPPAPFVEQVIQSAFAVHALTGLAVVAGLAILAIPAVAGRGSRPTDRGLCMVFGITWLTIITFAIIGNYPTPLVGYGSSAILGYCLSAAALAK